MKWNWCQKDGNTYEKKMAEVNGEESASANGKPH